jgi:hypothetical protein
MSRPRLLDLFCGAGGSAMGYHQAGFDVVGVDYPSWLDKMKGWLETRTPARADA